MFFHMHFKFKYYLILINRTLDRLICVFSLYGFQQSPFDCTGIIIHNIANHINVLDFFLIENLLLVEQL